MKKILPISLLAFTLFSAVSCGGNNPQESINGSNENESQTSEVNNTTPSFKAGDTVFEDKIIYDSSKEAYNVFVKLATSKNIVSISCGRAKGTTADFNLKDNVLTISGAFMSQIGSGEKEITVTYDDSTKDKISALIATKVITTAQEFQDINNNLTGVYVLGNDIDLSSIQNFEPLGRFYEETSTKNEYFHGILEGNGYTVKNGKVLYCSSPTSSQDVYYGGSLFNEDCHKQGNNIGIFQIIGSSGIVRNVTFDNITVRGKTIVGVIAGNISGTVENCIVTSSCSAAMGTHYYDNDCNMGAVAGIVAASGIVRNTVSYTSNLILPNEFMDYSEDYIGKIGNGADHTAEEGNTDPSWKYWNVDRPLMDYSSGSAVSTNKKEIDSNGVQSNGKYSFAGKTWGTIEDCYSVTFTNNVLESSARPICFTQTHLSKNKPGSGDSDMGTVTNSSTKIDEELKSSSTYTSYDNTIWNISDGSFPTLNYPLIKSYIAE